jgi:putative phosphoesterase
MFRIIIASDSHGRRDAVRELLERETQGSPSGSPSAFFHLGDSARDVSEFDFPGVEFISVLGNCDYMGGAPAERIYERGRARFFLTHGHKYGVKYGLDRLIGAAYKKKANICLFGHTHAPFLKEYEGIYFMNPGSLAFPRDGGPPRYGIADIGDEIRLSIYSIEKIKKSSGEQIITRQTDFLVF